jgi:hypothetical protein
METPKRFETRVPVAESGKMSEMPNLTSVPATPPTDTRRRDFRDVPVS